MPETPAEAIGGLEFAGDGRGPELTRMFWSSDGTILRAIEYRLSQDGLVRHVRLSGVQVVMVTPDEVVGQLPGDIDTPPVRGAYAVRLGRSPFLASFNPRHLGRCAHYRLRFYDELIDLICERVEFVGGSFQEAEA